MSSEPIIELNNIWKKYTLKGYFHNSIREDISNLFRKKQDDLLKQNEFWALQDVNIIVRRGECIGIYGSNGSGKTTILKLIASVTYPTQGELTVGGRVAPLIAVGAGFHKDLTGRENIYMNGAIIGMTISEIKQNFNSIVEFSELEKFIDMPIKRYSSGMRVRLGFSIAIHSKAEILLVDEILAVGDQSFKNKCNDKLKELIKSDKTILMVSHDLQRMKEITDRIVYIEKGQLVS